MRTKEKRPRSKRVIEEDKEDNEFEQLENELEQLENISTSSKR
jgi:hypothetical protein